MGLLEERPAMKLRDGATERRRLQLKRNRAVLWSALFDNDMLASIIKPRGPKWLGLARYVPYPLRAVKLSLDLNIFGFWWKPDWHYRKGLTESAKADGATIWYVRWLWFQVSYSRWV